VLFSGVVGIPTFTEWQRLMHFGKAIFNPNINLIPFVDGVHIDFILNVLCFLPLGFLLPIISRKYNNLKSILLIGLSISFFIELSQLFTLYRESDINDLITNGLGTLLGWLCFKILVKIGLFKPTQDYFLNGMTDSYWLPIIIAMTAFVNTFIS
jgi:glycopeptide antibiotics resistance protein